MGLIDQLRERKLVRWAAAYLAAGWAVLQLFDVMGPRWGLTDAALRAIDVVVGVGFLLTLVLAWYHGAKGRQRPSLTETALLGVVLALGIAALVLLPSARRPEGDGHIASAGTRTGRAVAVLPLENLSPDPSDAYMADGLDEEIIGRLARVSSLFVVARAAVERYQDSDLALEEIARQLSVEYVITGSVRTAGTRVRISTQLVDGVTQRQLWSETYERDLTVNDLFAIQSDLAQNVARSLSARILPEEAERIAVSPTESTEAYQHYLRGLSHWGRRSAIQDRIAAVEAFAAATAEDPQFGEGWAMLASASLYLRWLDANTAGDQLPGLGLSADGLLDRARSAVDLAVELAPEAAVTELARGNYLYQGLRDFEGALGLFSDAARRFPNDSDLAGAVGNVNRRLGRYDDALEWYLRAAGLGPSPQRLYTAAQTAQMMRSYTRALELADQAMTLAPDFRPATSVKYAAHMMSGDTASAWRVVAEFERLTGTIESGRRVEMARLRGGHGAALEEFRRSYGDDPSSLPYLYLLRRAGEDVPADAARAAITDARRRLAAWQDVEDPFARLLARSDLAFALAIAGERDEARREARQVLAQEPMRRDALIGWTAVDAALLASLLVDDVEPALQAVDRLITLPSFRSVEWLRLDPTYRALWDIPGFRSLIGHRVE